MKQQGKSLNGLVIQPGRQLVFKQDGSVSGQVTYKCDASRAFALRPGIGSPHPDYGRAQCFNATVTVNDAGLAEILCDYLGIMSDPTIPIIEFVGNTGEEPIETHRNFVSSIGGTNADPKNSAQFDQETGEFIGFPPDAGHNLGGVRGYLNPACTVRVTFYTSSSSWGLYQLGDIAWPPGGVPNPPDSRNWLKTNWSRRNFGLIYQITEEYTASGKRGWNPTIYG